MTANPDSTKAKKSPIEMMTMIVRKKTVFLVIAKFSQIIFEGYETVSAYK